MITFFDAPIKAEYERPDAMVCKKLVLGQDVTLGGFTTLSIDTEKGIIHLDKIPDEDCTNGLPECCFIVEKVGLVRDIETHIEVLFLDNGMFIGMSEGVLCVNTEEGLFPVARNIPDNKLYNLKEEEIVWVTKDKIINMLKYYVDVEGGYINDYLFALTVKGSMVSTNAKGMKSFNNITLRPADTEFMYDISGGKVTSIINKREEKKRYNTLLGAKQSSFDGFRLKLADKDDFVYDARNYESSNTLEDEDYEFIDVDDFDDEDDYED